MSKHRIFDVGASRELGRFECGVELVFAIQARRQCGGATYLSTDPARARVTRLARDRWLLAWEDWEDGDFNDSVVLVKCGRILQWTLNSPTFGPIDLLGDCPGGILLLNCSSIFFREVRWWSSTP